eukprot:9403579-Ditylum_brightwellii.AAC.1
MEGSGDFFVQYGVGTLDSRMDDLQALLNSASPDGVKAVLTRHAHQLPKLSMHFDSTGGSAEVLRQSDTLCLSHSPSFLLDGK